MKQYKNINELKNWENNPRNIKEDGFKRLKKQIQELGQYKPLIVTEDGVVLGGNMRLRAYRELGINEVWVSEVKAETEEDKMRYALSDNDRAGYYDADMLSQLEGEYPDFEWESYAVDFLPPKDLRSYIKELEDITEKYTKKIKTPTYEPKGEKPTIDELVGKNKTDKLLQEIESADIPDEIKEFLRMSAYRHYVFDYAKIAEFYAQSEQPVQELMEKSGLIIIDIKKAIENGFVKLTEELTDILQNEYAE